MHNAITKRIFGLVLLLTVSPVYSAESNQQSDAYVNPTQNGVSVTPLITVGETAANGYKLVGNPDGLGALDFSNDSFKLYMNHELPEGSGVVRKHGNKGAFVSEWLIDKHNLKVLQGKDFVTSAEKINLWKNNQYEKSGGSFSKLCSANLPPANAFFNPKTKNGYDGQFFMSGEENGSEGRAFAFVVSGKEAGDVYELPALGKYSRENILINPFLEDQTVVVGTQDANPGHIYVYVGYKSNTGNAVERAGLSQGKLYVLRTKSENLLNQTPSSFSLVDVNPMQSGKQLEEELIAKHATQFIRPEDGHWANKNTFYFVTTGDDTNSAKLFKITFSKTNDFSLGGEISLVKDSLTLIGKDQERARYFDNITVSESSNIIIQEDPGGDKYIAKTWYFMPTTNMWHQILESNRKYFTKGNSTYLTSNEENSGVIDITKVLNRNDGKEYYIATTQAHYKIPGELVSGGQLYMFSIDKSKLK